MNRIIIIGGGPGGLTLAIALRQAGFDPLIFERTRMKRELGSGLTLWPNAMKALDRLELAQAIWSISLPFAGIAMRSWRGKVLFDVSQDKHQEDSSEVYGAAVHRAELLNLLLGELGRDAVRGGFRYAGFRQDEEKVTAIFGDGSEEQADLLIGADGINSPTRSQLFGESHLRYAGYTVWRGVTNFDLGQSAGLTSMGYGAQFGLFPMTRNRVYWFGSVNAPEGEKDWPVGRKRELIERFSGWHDPIKAVIEATNESAILRNDIYDLEPLKRWSEGRVTLLGDAAHPATPNLGQGACQAIEDAVVLAACLRDYTELPAALKAYESHRIERTSSITIQSRRMGKIGCWTNPLACWFRDQMIQRLPELVRRQQLSRVFHFEI